MVDSQRLAVVTGTSSGIGEALAHELLRRGWRVVGLSRRPSSFDDRRYTHLQVDLRDVSDLALQVETSVGDLVAGPGMSRLALVNNAADPGLLGPVSGLDAQGLLRVYAVNVAAPVWLMGWLVRRGPPQASLRIVNVTSGAAVTPFPGLGAYGSAKAALRMAGMVLAAEVAGSSEPPRDITILSYGPGPVDTPMQATARATPVERFPLREMFQQWATDGQLMPPRVPAMEIATYVEDDGYPAFHECRSGELRRPGSGRA